MKATHGKLNSEVFLQKYRVLEGMLERRYERKKISYSSVIRSVTADYSLHKMVTDMRN